MLDLVVIQIVVQNENIEPVFNMTAQQFDDLIFYLEVSAGALLEINMLLKVLAIMWIIIMAWKLVRR